ncbi:hypothetical protein GCM10027612_05260 [Microbispora bryophytorum subsp. camponoti]
MGFVGMIVVAVVVVHGYLWWRLVRASTTPGSRPRRVLTWVLVILAAVMVVTFGGSRLGLGMDVERVVAWPGYLWLAVMFYLFVFGLVMEVPRAVATFVTSRRRRAAETAVPAGRAEEETAPVDEVVLAGAAAGEALPLTARPRPADRRRRGPRRTPRRSTAGCSSPVRPPRS